LNAGFVFDIACFGSVMPGFVQFALRQQAVADAIENRIELRIQPAERGRFFLERVFLKAEAPVASRRTREVPLRLNATKEGEQPDARNQNLAEGPEPPRTLITKLLQPDGAHLAYQVGLMNWSSV
jgi:hypothetical protein